MLMLKNAALNQCILQHGEVIKTRMLVQQTFPALQKSAFHLVAYFCIMGLFVFSGNRICVCWNQ